MVTKKKAEKKVSKKGSARKDFNIRLPRQLVEQFAETVPDKANKQIVGEVMVRLWVSLPEEIRVNLIVSEWLSDWAEDASCGVGSFQSHVDEVTGIVAGKAVYKDMSPEEQAKSLLKAADEDARRARRVKQ